MINPDIFKKNSVILESVPLRKSPCFLCSSEDIASTHCCRLGSVGVDIEMDFRGQDVYYGSMLVKGLGTNQLVEEEEVKLQFSLNS